MHRFQTRLLTSLLTLTSSLLQTAEAQRGPLRLTADELLPYQICTSDDDCVYANNGVCDCANGGEEVSINKSFKAEFKDLFPPMFCTQLAPEIPCGTGAGNVCINSQCVFQECANREEAKECVFGNFLSEEERVDRKVEHEECVKEACAVSSPVDLGQNETETDLMKPVADLPDPPQQLPQSLIVNGKFTQEELEQFQYCERDIDCVYANNGFCDCANGGEEVAINLEEFLDFQNIFHSRRRKCTRMARELSCGIGGGVVCGEDNLCKFESCKNVDGALACKEQGKKEFEVDECARLVCAIEPEPLEIPDEEEEDKNKGLLGTLMGNIFGRGKN